MAHDSEGERAFKGAAARTEHAQTCVSRGRARVLQQARLAHAGLAADGNQPPASGRTGCDRRSRAASPFSRSSSSTRVVTPRHVWRLGFFVGSTLSRQGRPPGEHVSQLRTRPGGRQDGPVISTHRSSDVSRRFAFAYFMKDRPRRIREVAPYHIDYWREIQDARCIAGPFADRCGGLVLFDAASLEEAATRGGAGSLFCSRPPRPLVGQGVDRPDPGPGRAP